MQTVIWNGDELLEAPVAEAAQRFLEDEVGPALEPMTESEYRDGPAVLLGTEARFVYVVDGHDVLWVVEWPPGIVVVRFTPEGTYEAARVAVDADEDHPVVELVAGPWAAQFDADDRAELGFGPARDETAAAWEAGTAAVQRLGEALSAQLADESAVEAWRLAALDSPWVRET